MMNRYMVASLIILISSILNASSQSTSFDLPRLAEKNKLQVINRAVSISSTYPMKSVHLSARENDGVAWIEGLTFSNGVIEIDMKGQDLFQQSFVGIAFHGVDEKTLDVVYFRPFNFKSTDPTRRSHAVQYASHPEYPWAVLRDKFPGEYEKPVLPPPNPDEWFHVKIIVSGPQVKVFVNNHPEACLTVQPLNKRSSGKLGLWVGNQSAGDFANLKITMQ